MQNFDRTKILISDNGIEKLNSCHILLVGVGGVGGYVAEMLVRAGIGEITIIDCDKVDETNINRQLIATYSSIGKSKVETSKARLLDINPNLKISVINQKFCKTNADKILSCVYDFVIDAIDDVENKLLLIKMCHEKNLPIVSALGSGNRIEIPNFVVEDINKTENDGLAKKIRLGLRELGIKKHTVVYSKQNRINTNTKEIGSISYFPAMCGCVLSAYVINKLLEEENGKY